LKPFQPTCRIFGRDWNIRNADVDLVTVMGQVVLTIANWSVPDQMNRYLLPLMFVLASIAQPVHADSSSPRLAAYYERQMAIVGTQTYAWIGDEPPAPLPFKAVQVGVGQSWFYVLTVAGSLIGFREDHAQRIVLMSGLKWFASGRSGVLAIATDDTLWWMSRAGKNKQRIADDVSAAAVGDGANYYITSSGALFVKGSAHRGQYGDGRLKSTKRFVQTATDARQITAHTGHAILLKASGDVLGTGGNIYGPVGRHGLGDKAVRWSKILSGARSIATGSSHSLAIRKDGTLMAWGSSYGPEPKPVMSNAVAVAAGSRTTIALRRDGSLWQWSGGHKPRKILDVTK